MVSFREKLKDRGQVQVSMWLPDSVADRAKALAKERGLSLPKLFEAAIDVYAGCPVDASINTSNNTGILFSRLESIEGVIADMGSQFNAIQESVSTVVSSVFDLSERMEQVEAMGKQGSDLLSDSDRELMALGNVDPADLLNKKNGVRNRRILEMHRDGMNPGAIAAVLEADGLPRSGRGCVEPFLKKCGITPHLSR